jgi:hypothetical protein
VIVTFFGIAVGLIVGTMVWYAASFFVARSIVWLEARHPAMNDSRAIRAWELSACGLLVLACLALAFVIARAISAH